MVLLEDVDAAAGAAVGMATAGSAESLAAVAGAGVTGASGSGTGEAGESSERWGGGGGRGVGGGRGGGDSLLTLPGLLNALDGVGAVDGRLLFMTCHRAESLVGTGNTARLSSDEARTLVSCVKWHANGIP